MSAYYAVPMRKEDIPKTAFISKWGLFEFLILPMGVRNGPATFQRLMELALSGLQWISCLVYLDDILVYRKSFDEHLRRLAAVLQRFREAGLKLKPSKCTFFQKEVKFLGHLINGKGVLPDPDNVQKIVAWPTPTDCKGV